MSLAHICHHFLFMVTFFQQAAAFVYGQGPTKQSLAAAGVLQCSHSHLPVQLAKTKTKRSKNKHSNNF